MPNHGPVCLFKIYSNGYRQAINCNGGMDGFNKPFYLMDQPVCGNNHYVMKVNPYGDVLETNMNNNEISGDVFVSCP